MPPLFSAYTLVGLSAVVGALAGLLTFAVARFAVAARRGGGASDSTQATALYAALQEAVETLKTQERAAAARAEASERLNAEIITSLTAGLLVVGLKGEIRILNPAGRRMLDLPTEGAYERTARERPLFDVVDECLSGREAIVRRAVALPDVASGVHLGVTVSPLADERGAPQGAICLFTDLTAVKDLEEQLRLRESLATVGELTAGIAHEFRNGLATIHGYGKLIDLQELPEPYRAYVEGIRAETTSLTQVVTNFLNFARPAQFVLAPVDLASVCGRAVEEVRADVAIAGGAVGMEGEFGVVQGDEVLLRQAFSNLLRNAVEACQSRSVAPSILITGTLDRSLRTVRIAVDDNGPGVSANAREKIFRPFFTSKRDGTGLGLAIVQKIIVFHNGRIVAAASPHGGASFQISLPVL